MASEIERLVVRHRHVAPMLSALLAGTNATCILRDPDGTVVLHREGRDIGTERQGPFAVVGDGREIGTVEGGPLARTIATILSYAVSRELDKKALAREALDRYRELSLIYDLAGTIGAELDVSAVADAAVAEVGRLPAGATGFLLLLDEATGTLSAPAGLAAGGRILAGRLGEGICGRVAVSGNAEVVNIPAADPAAAPEERAVPAILCAAMRAHGRVVGVLGGTAGGPTEYRAGDLKVVEAIAALAAPALDHARVHEAAVRDAAARERALEARVAALEGGDAAG